MPESHPPRTSWSRELAPPVDQPFQARRRLSAALLLLASPRLHAQSVSAKESWSGNFILTLQGSGTNERAVPGLPGGKARVTWRVDRTARGRMVLDRMFKGGGIAGTPDTRNTDRYETWVATSAQPLDMVIDDQGSYFGYIPSGHVALDEIGYKCPMPDAKHPHGQLRSGILQFDRQKGTWSLETGRLIHRCATSHLRTPKHGPASWLVRAPFDLRSNPFELQFEIWHGLDPLNDFHLLTGPYTEGATELVLTRSFVFNWSNPLTERAPVQGRLELVLRKLP